MSDDRAADAPQMHVFTFKEGLLSAVAHDLRLRVERFEVELREGRVHARVDAASLRVDGVMRGGRLDASVLSGRDCEKIERAIREDVLDTARHPEAALEAGATARGVGYALAGTLTLHGAARPLSFDVAADASALRAGARLTPSAWGIRPYRALGGTLRVKDEVRIEVVLPRAGLDPARGVAQSFRWSAGS